MPENLIIFNRVLIHKLADTYKLKTHRSAFWVGVRARRNGRANNRNPHERNGPTDNETPENQALARAWWCGWASTETSQMTKRKHPSPKHEPNACEEAV